MNKKRSSILSIDDEAGYQRMVVKCLTSMTGHMVAASLNGADGIKAAFSQKPDIILLDMVMPDLSGLQVIEALYSDPRTRHIPVIVITGASLTETEHLGFKKKGNFRLLLQKPIDMSELIGEINEILLQGKTTLTPAGMEYTGRD